MFKKLAPYLVFALIVVLMVWGRVAVGAGTEYKAGAAALSRGDLPAAVHHFDRAIHWYSPGSGPVAQSAAGLQRAASQYEKKGDNEGALYTWRILRSALYGVRHVRQPYPDVIAKCDERIATLMALKAGPQGSEEFEKERKLRHARLSRKVGPKTGYALLAEAGFFGWVASAFLFIWLGVRPDRGFHGRRAALFSLLFVVFYALWIFGLAKA